MTRDLFKGFGVDLPGTLNSALGPGLEAATLIKVTAGTRTAGALSGGRNPTEASFAAKGYVDSYADREIDGTFVQRGDRKIGLLGASIAGGQVPKPNDKITIGGATYRICADGVTTDPATALYLCQCRVT